MICFAEEVEGEGEAFFRSLVTAWKISSTREPAMNRSAILRALVRRR